MKTSTKKTETMAFRGKDPMRTKIVISEDTFEQVSHVNYLGCNILYDYSTDIEQKMNTFTSIFGATVGILKHKTRNETRVRFYKVGFCSYVCE